MHNQRKSQWLEVAVFLLVAVGSAAVPAATRPSLAIINFTNQDLDNPEWQWLSKGLADMLITDLARTDKIQLVDRDKVQNYLDEIALAESGVIDKKTALRLGQIAKVTKALFGNYRVENGRIEIQAYVINVDGNNVERVESVTGSVKDILDLEKNLALKIVENLHVPLTQKEIDSVIFKATDSLDAAARFYRGLDSYDNGQYFNALREFRLTEKNDPSYDKPLLFQGHVFENLGEYKHAIVAFKKLASRIPNSEFAVEALFITAKLSANEFHNYVEALRIADQIIQLYPDGKLRDGTVIAQQFEPAPAITVNDSYNYSLRAILHLYKSSLYVRSKNFRSALREVEAAADGMPQVYHDGNLAYLRQLVEYAYAHAGEVLIPAAAPNVIRLDALNPTYEENYSSNKRVIDAFQIQSVDSSWRNEIIKPYGYDEQRKQNYISNKYFKAKKQWMTTADSYLFAAPEGYIVESVDVWLEGFQTQTWTLDALVVTVGDYNSKGATGGTRKGYLKDHYRAPVLAGTKLFRLLIQIAGDFTKQTDQFAYINGWKIKANLKKVGNTASLEINSNTNILVFVDPVPGQVADANSIAWRNNPSKDCPCTINNLSAGPHRLVAFAAGAGRSIKNDGRRQEIVVDIKPDQVNAISINYTVLQAANDAAEVLPGWANFHRVLQGFSKVGSGGRMHQLAGMQKPDGAYQAFFTKNFDIWITTSSDGVIWARAEPLPAPINTQSQEGEFSIIQGENGVFYMAFLSARGADKGLYVSRSKDMKRWIKPRKIVSLKHLRGSLSLLQLADGSFRIYYPPASHTLTYVASNDFKSWVAGAETKVDYQDFGQVAVDGTGSFWLLYGGYDDRDHVFFISTSHDGNDWQQFSKIDASDANHNLGSQHPVLVPKSGIGVALAWQRTARLAFSYSKDGINWSPSSAEIESRGKLDYPGVPFTFFGQNDGTYMLIYSNSHGELWSATSEDPFK